ncbi:MAG: hypothetical protein ACSLE0_11260, partial [Chitinophagaceae bacterium]
MLKRKLLRSGLFVNVLMIILAAVHATGTQQSFIVTSQVMNEPSIQPVSFDEDLLQFNGLIESGAIDAPTITLRQEALKFANNYLASNGEM